MSKWYRNRMPRDNFNKNLCLWVCQGDMKLYETEIEKRGVTRLIKSMIPCQMFGKQVEIACDEYGCVHAHSCLRPLPAQHTLGH